MAPHLEAMSLVLLFILLMPVVRMMALVILPSPASLFQSSPVVATTALLLQVSAAQPRSIQADLLTDHQLTPEALASTVFIKVAQEVVQ